MYVKRDIMFFKDCTYIFSSFFIKMKKKYVSAMDVPDFYPEGGTKNGRNLKTPKT